MSKEANELLLELLASRIDAAGAHCGGSPDEEPDEPCDPDEPPGDPDDKDDKTIRLF